MGTDGSAVSEEDRRLRRELSAQRAEQRQEATLARGVGDVTKARKMQQATQRDDILGRIAEHYAALQEDMPMGLRLMDVAQLQKHLQDVQARRRSGSRGGTPSAADAADFFPNDAV